MTRTTRHTTHINAQWTHTHTQWAGQCTGTQYERKSNKKINNCRFFIIMRMIFWDRSIFFLLLDTHSHHATDCADVLAHSPCNAMRLRLNGVQMAKGKISTSFTDRRRLAQLVIFRNDDEMIKSYCDVDGGGEELFHRICVFFSMHWIENVWLCIIAVSWWMILISETTINQSPGHTMFRNKMRTNFTVRKHISRRT